MNMTIARTTGSKLQQKYKKVQTGNAARMDMLGNVARVYVVCFLECKSGLSNKPAYDALNYGIPEISIRRYKRHSNTEGTNINECMVG